VLLMLRTTCGGATRCARPAVQEEAVATKQIQLLALTRTSLTVMNNEESESVSPPLSLSLASDLASRGAYPT
jgi:hypothetical protein